MAIRIISLLFLFGLAAATTAAPSRDEEVPAGTATNWIIGHRLLRDGDAKSALPFLHLAYRAQPDEPLIALDFQYALAAEGYLADAVVVMDDLLAAHPDSSAWRLRRSSLNLRAGRNDAALEDLRELRRRGEITLDVLGTEAAIHLRQGRIGAALDAYRDGLYILPEHRADIYLGMVDVLQQADETQRIPELLQEALAAEPGNPGLHLALLRTYAVLGRHDEALAEARRADREVLPLRPTAPEGTDEDVEVLAPNRLPGLPGRSPRAAERWPEESFSVDLADVYARTGDMDRAISVLENLQAEGTLGADATLWLARMLIGTGRHEDATGLVAQITTRWPDDGRGWFLRGKLAESRDDWPAAVQEHRHAVDLAPQDPELNVALVRAMLVAWESDLAGGTAAADTLREELHRAAMKAAVQLPAADASGHLVLGYAFRAADDQDRAAWRFGMAAEDPGLRLGALIQQSICYDETGDFARARRVLDRLRREYPEDAEVANSYGYFLAEKNMDLELAEELVREALAAEPNNGAFLDSLGWIFYRLGRFDDAFDYLVRAVNVLPEDPVVLEHLGVTLLAMGRGDEARSALERALAAGGDRERLEGLITGADDADTEPER